MKRLILHMDMDAFYAQVEQHDNPKLQGKPVVVGSDPKEGKGRGVVSTCSYEARTFGIHSAMPISKAYKLCPHAQFIRPRMDRYKEISRIIMKTCSLFSPYVEPLSLDEAFLDCSHSELILGKPEEIGMSLKNKILRATGLTSSVGISSSKSVAKIASDLQKPDGLVICPDGEEKQFLSELSISHLWGVGKKTRSHLESLGFYKIGDIASRSEKEMYALCGKNGIHLWYMANGIDSRSVDAEPSMRKSLSEEITFENDLEQNDALEICVKQLSDDVTFQLRLEHLRAKTVQVKIRFEDFTTYTRSYTFPEYITDFKNVYQTAYSLLRSVRHHDPHKQKIRLIGVGLSKLKPEQEEQQFTLFENSLAKKEEKKESLLDQLKQQYGKKIGRATLINEQSRWRADGSGKKERERE